VGGRCNPQIIESDILRLKLVNKGGREGKTVVWIHNEYKSVRNYLNLLKILKDGRSKVFSFKPTTKGALVTI